MLNTPKGSKTLVLGLTPQSHFYWTIQELLISGLRAASHNVTVLLS